MFTEWNGRGFAEVDDHVLDARSVGFTPIKGTRHRAQPQARFDAAGPVGDRRFCLIDVGTRRVLRTVQNPRLFAVVARLHGEGLEVTLPDGRSVSGVPDLSGETLTCDYWGRQVPLALTGGTHDELLSAHLGRAVRLAEAPRGAIVFGRPLTIVTTASLAEVADRAGHPTLLREAARFRATLLVHTEEPFVEETWAGREMRVRGVGTSARGGETNARGGETNARGVGTSARGGETNARGVGTSARDIGTSAELRVRIGAPVPRCAVIDLDPVTGKRNARLLATLAATRTTNRAGEPFFGVYAEVV
ncbi:MOSC N-terminal beta barrel domain-containing protein [Brevibacterium ammoniilyticum]